MKHLKRFAKEYALLIFGLILLHLSFPAFFYRPGDFMFQDLYDGFKNYLTVRAYLSPVNESILLYEQMNYPFGEYIFYTDNSPAISVPLKFLIKIFGDFSPWGIWIYSGVWLLLMLMSPIVLFRSLKKLHLDSWFVALGCLILVWTNPQLDRFNIGHFNLTACIFYIWMIRVMISYFLADRDQDGKKIISVLLELLLLIFLSSFVHLYYLPLLVLFFGLFVFILSFRRLIRRDLFAWRNLGLSAAASLLGGGLVFAILRISDRYYSLRKDGASGYGWDYWEHAPKSLWTSPAHALIDFPLSVDQSIGYEGTMYLGWFIWVGIFLSLVAVVWRGMSRLKRHRFFPFFLSILIVALINYLIGIGDDEVIFGKRHHNYLNLFELIKPLYEGVTHFRCLGRFAWWSFWTLGIVSIAAFDWLWKKQGWSRYLIWIPLVLGLTDVTGWTQRFKKHNNKRSNLSVRAIDERLGSLPAAIEGYTIDAMLPLPYYHVGTEDMSLTVDPHAIQMIHHSQLSVGLGIPSIATQLSRSPLDYSREVWSWFHRDPYIHQDFSTRLQGKTILIVKNKAFYAGTSEYKPKHEAFINPGVHDARDFLNRSGARQVHQDYFYEYYLLEIP